MVNWVKPGSTIGIIGGGSVARLLAISAKNLGYSVGILDPDVNCLARNIADWHLRADFTNEEAMMDLAMKSDTVIYETEAFPSRFVDLMEKAVPVPQGEELLSVSQDRMLQKAFLESVRVNIAPFATIVTIDDIREAVKSIGFPCVLKANSTNERFKEHHLIYGEEDIVKAEEFLKHGTCVLEAWIPFDKEVCVSIIKDKNNEITLFPITEMKYRNDVFYQSIAPARIDYEMKKEVERIGRVIAEQLNFTGVMAVEVFATESGSLYVNEIVAHPHRAFHYTFNSFLISQYEAHIKAVTGWQNAPTEEMPYSIIMQSITKDELSESYTQAQIKPDWRFIFYENNGEALTSEVGHVGVPTENVKETLATLSDIFK